MLNYSLTQIYLNHKNEFVSNYNPKKTLKKFVMRIIQSNIKPTFKKIILIK
jgi:hypothetical protein